MHHHSSRPARQHCTVRRGVVTVELAFVLPILFMVLFGSIEFSRLNMLKHLANVAAYEGARSGMCVGNTDTDVIAKATQILNAGSVVSPTITVTPSTITETTTDVQVDISIPVAGNFWLAPKYVTSAVTGTCTLTTERPGG